MADEITTPKEQQEPSEPSDDGGAPAEASPEMIGGEGELAMAGGPRTASGGMTLHFSMDLPFIPSLRTLPRWTYQQMLNLALIVAVVGLLAYLLFFNGGGGGSEAAASNVAADAHGAEVVSAGNIAPNLHTSFNPTVETPTLGHRAHVDEKAWVMGNAHLGDESAVAPFASIRADEGQPIQVGSGSAVLEQASISGLRTFNQGGIVHANMVEVDGAMYSVYVGDHVVIGRAAVVRGPVAIMDEAYIGDGAQVFRATVGEGAFVEPGAFVEGVTIPAHHYVPAGEVVTTQAQADALPEVPRTYDYMTIAAQDREAALSFAGPDPVEEAMRERRELAPESSGGAGSSGGGGGGGGH